MLDIGGDGSDGVHQGWKQYAFTPTQVRLLHLSIVVM